MNRLALLAPLILLAACDRQPAAKADAGNGVEVASANTAAPGTVSIDVPGFKAKIDVPDLNMSGGDGDAIDGVPLYPGTHINGASVFSSGADKNGAATIRYAAPASPGTVLAYYRDHASRAGYRLAAGPADSVIAAKPDGSRFTIVAHASADGATTGSLTASGR